MLSIPNYTSYSKNSHFLKQEVSSVSPSYVFLKFLVRKAKRKKKAYKKEPISFYPNAIAPFSFYLPLHSPSLSLNIDLSKLENTIFSLVRSFVRSFVWYVSKRSNVSFTATLSELLVTRDAFNKFSH